MATIPSASAHDNTNCLVESYACVCTSHTDWNEEENTWNKDTTMCTSTDKNQCNTTVGAREYYMVGINCKGSSTPVEIGP
jgi:hypothetical protein